MDTLAVGVDVAKSAGPGSDKHRIRRHPLRGAGDREIDRHAAGRNRARNDRPAGYGGKGGRGWRGGNQGRPWSARECEHGDDDRPRDRESRRKPRSDPRWRSTGTTWFFRAGVRYSVRKGLQATAKPLVQLIHDASGLASPSCFAACAVLSRPSPALRAPRRRFGRGLARPRLLRGHVRPQDNRRPFARTVRASRPSGYTAPELAAPKARALPPRHAPTLVLARKAYTYPRRRSVPNSSLAPREPRSHARQSRHG
jgi:hypothetical protein